MKTYRIIPVTRTHQVDEGGGVNRFFPEWEVEADHMDESNYSSSARLVKDGVVVAVVPTDKCLIIVQYKD